jgi:hypothetical protein
MTSLYFSVFNQSDDFLTNVLESMGQLGWEGRAFMVARGIGMGEYAHTPRTGQ